MNFDSLITNPLTGIVIGTFVAVYIYYISKKERYLVYDYRKIKYISNQVNNDSDSKLEFFYDGTKIQNYYVYILCLLNKGKESIRLEDIVKKDPINVKSESKSFIDMKILFKNSEKNNIELIENERLYEIKFDFLDHYDGAIFQIISENPILISGSIIEQKVIKKVDLLSIDNFSAIIRISPIIGGLAIIALSDSFLNSLTGGISSLNRLIATITIFASIMTISAAIGFTIKNRMNHFKPEILKKFQSILANVPEST